MPGFFLFTAVKHLLLLVLISATALARAQDTVTVYLTHDLWVNSCLLVWQETELNLRENLRKGNVPLYDPASEKKAKLKNYGKSLDYPVPTLEGDTLTLPVERLSFRTRHKWETDFLMVMGHNDFNGDTIQIGLLEVKDLLNLDAGNAPVLRLMNQYTGIFRKEGLLTSADIYVQSVLLADTLAKRLHHLGRNLHSLPVLGRDGEIFNDSLIDEQISLHAGTIEENGTYKVVKGWVDENDRWKGLVLQSTPGEGLLLHRTIGVLYHARTKFAGFDPGYMPWFFVRMTDLKKVDPDLFSGLQLIGDNAVKYLLDKDSYLSNYFREANIRINNSRYPYH